jgi:hypothetical protein
MCSDDQEVGESEKLTHFGCGALLGVFVGLGLVGAFTLSSYGAIAAALLVSILACGFSAMVYRDRFWYSLKDWIS